MTTDGIPKRGDIIAGKFQVEDVLGKGGMGVVIAARHLVLRQRVAVKFLLPEATRLPEASARFVREARAAVAIQSEHVARVLDVGTLDNGAPYMVMEFLSGTDFAKVLKKRGPLPISDAVDFILQAGEAIAEAHAHGIVHRDLKPGNLFLTSRAEGSPLVKVLDFGLSKMALADDGAPEASLTVTGLVAGSPYYMSPEQVRSLKDVDWRADIWALGVILYEMLTGRRAFEAPTLTAVCASIIADAPKPPRSHRSEIPEVLEAAVMGCLEKDPRKRTRSVAELAEAIAPFASTQSAALVERIRRLQPSTGTAPLAGPDADAAATLVLSPWRSEPAAAASVRETAGIEPNEPTLAPLQEVAPQAAVPQAATSNTGQASAWGQTQIKPPRRPVGWLVGAAGVSLVALVTVGLWLSRGDASRPAAPPSPSAIATSTTTSPEPSADAPAAAMSAEPVAASASATQEPTASPTAEPARAPTPASAGAQPSAPAPRNAVPPSAAVTAKPHAADKPAAQGTDASAPTPTAKPANTIWY
ncbi:MAG: protein kinase [Minicystis sp.]